MFGRSLCLTLLAALLFLVGCGGDDGDGGSEGGGQAASELRQRLGGAVDPKAADFPRPKRGQSMQEFADAIGATGTEVALAGSVFTTGHSRIPFGILQGGRFVYAPTVVYVARSPRSTEISGPIAAPVDPLVTEPPFRSRQAASEKDPFAAVYEARAVDFERPGRHVLLMVSRVNGRLVAAPAQVKVIDAADDSIPAAGDPAPRVETDTVAESGGIEAVETRIPPDDMHEVDFADVVGKKPVALLFATPQLCQSRVCGPVTDIAAQLKDEYGDQVEFIHQEVYVDNDLNKGLREPLKRFNLSTEPWLFTIDADGRVAARLEGSFGVDAFERAVQAAIARGG
jgi:hypothetical protein